MRPQNGTFTVRFFAGVRDLFPDKSMEVTLERSPSVGDLIEALCDSPERRGGLLDETGALRKDIVILVNGRSIVFLGGLDAALDVGDVVAVFPPVYGG